MNESGSPPSATKQNESWEFFEEKRGGICNNTNINHNHLNSFPLAAL